MVSDLPPPQGRQNFGMVRHGDSGSSGVVPGRFWMVLVNLAQVPARLRMVANERKVVEAEAWVRGWFRIVLVAPRCSDGFQKSKCLEVIVCKLQGMMRLRPSPNWILDRRSLVVITLSLPFLLNYCLGLLNHNGSISFAFKCHSLVSSQRPDDLSELQWFQRHVNYYNSQPSALKRAPGHIRPYPLHVFYHWDHGQVSAWRPLTE